MSSQSWNPPSTKKHLSEVVLSENNPRTGQVFGPIIPLTMTKKFKKLITYFCQNINKVEWSGILFYEVKGSIRNPKKLKIICHDVHLMDKGSAAYTEFTTDPSIVGYMMKNPNLLKMKQGLIHSHNTMDTFFSGEDNDELQLTAGDHNFYLSLIVNNFGDACAKIAWVGETKVVLKPKYQCRDEQGEYYTIAHGEEKEVTEKVLFKLACNVISPTVSLPMEDKYVERLKLIEQKAEAKRQQQAANNKTWTSKGPIQNIPKTNTPASTVNTDMVYAGGFPDDAMQAAFDKEIADLSSDEMFNCMALRFGNVITDDTIEEAISDIEAFGMNIQHAATAIVDSLPAFYEKFYDINQADIIAKEYAETVEFFIMQLEEAQDEETLTNGKANAFIVLLVSGLQAHLNDYTLKAKNTNNEPRTEPA